jgi:hypothetical protein
MTGMNNYKYYQLMIAFLLMLSFNVKGQNDTITAKSSNQDSSLFKSDKYIVKKGYNLAPLPEFIIDPFIGLYLGIYSTIFDYGDGKLYPNFYRSLTIAAAHGTKGKTNFGLDYISYSKFILSAKISYTKSTMYPFYGYNGYQTLYDEGYHDDTKNNYITSPFYNYQQKLSRLVVFIQDTIRGTFFNWQVGFDLGYYKTSRVDFAKLNKGVDSAELAPDLPTLYDRYIAWGIISDKEKDGGWANAIRMAMVYDTRDRLTNPMQGIWTDLTLRYTPSFLGSEKTALQLAFTHRHYITILKEKLSFAYRLRYDACFGKLPFYTSQILADGIEGIGGTNTLWGIHQNRIIANQFAMGNFELRAKLIRFKFIKQNWYLGLVPLFHTGYMIKGIDMNLSGLTQNEFQTYFSTTSQKWYSSYGVGGKIVMNENTVIGVDWAHSVNSGAGNDALYVGLGYSF